MAEIRIEPRANGKARKAILTGLLAYNRPFLGRAPSKPLLVTVRDAEGEVKGGLVGAIRLEWLHVDLVWLDETLRGQELGRELLLTAEEEARRRGARHIHLESWTFQAPEFYKKLGYREFGRLEDFPKGHATVFLTKAL